MSRKPDPVGYVTKIDPRLTQKGEALQVLCSPSAWPRPEPELEAEAEP